MSAEGYDQEWLALEAAMGGRSALTGDVDVITAQYNAVGVQLAPHWGAPLDTVSTYDTKINEHVTVRIYTPKSLQTGQTLPVGLYYHGGGYIAGDLDFEDPICRRIAHLTPCIVVAVEYRLAPKFKLPIGIEDGYNAFLWAHGKAAELRGDPSAFFTIGGSAGAGIALAVAEKLIRNGKRNLVKGVIAMNPITAHFSNPPAKYKHIYKSYGENTMVPLIDKHCMDISFESSGARPDDSAVFIALSPNLSFYPPVYLVSCEKDILRDDCIVLEHMLKDAGVKVKRDHYPGYPHYFFVFPSLKKTAVCLQNIVNGIKFVLGK
ncbi:lipase [Coleophoma cylindrospora]|uniref:Lipase n=1 Tax=Coleophoma cylindrospora TaxID=1849047 RepID=A0A3D8RUR2_9HELO|nr:lipase [Coleophoma cylindrospora]